MEKMTKCEVENASSAAQFGTRVRQRNNTNSPLQSGMKKIFGFRVAMRVVVPIVLFVEPIPSRKDYAIFNNRNIWEKRFKFKKFII